MFVIGRCGISRPIEPRVEKIPAIAELPKHALHQRNKIIDGIFEKEIVVISQHCASRERTGAKQYFWRFVLIIHRNAHLINCFVHTGNFQQIYSRIDGILVVSNNASHRIKPYPIHGFGIEKR